VLLPAGQSSAITGISADAPCTATDGGAGQITVTTTVAATCDVDVQLLNGDAYVLTVAFRSSSDTCCGALVAGYTASIPHLVNKTVGADGLPMVAAGCVATCGAGAGPEQPPADVDAAAAAVAGRWRICGGWPNGLPSGVVGIELDPVVAESADGVESGNAYWLVSGPSGPVPGTKFDYLLTYDIEVWLSDSGPVTYMVIQAAPGAGAAGVVHISACPLEVEIAAGSPGTVLIPFGS
jgi:hypothetical protein